MKHNEIKQLCQKFMDGQTSIEEEHLLAEYFRGHPHEEELEDIAALFRLFDTGMPVEQAANPRRAWWQWAVGVAAVLLLCLGIALTLLYEPAPRTTTPAPPRMVTKTEKAPVNQQKETVHQPKNTPPRLAEVVTPPRPKKVRRTIAIPTEKQIVMKPASPESDSLAAVVTQRQQMATALVELYLERQSRAVDCFAEMLACMELYEVQQIEEW